MLLFIQSCRKNSEESDNVPAKEANVICPQVVITYYLERIVFQPPATGNKSHPPGDDLSENPADEKKKHKAAKVVNVLMFCLSQINVVCCWFYSCNSTTGRECFNAVGTKEEKGRIRQGSTCVAIALHRTSINQMIIYNYRWFVMDSI